MVGTAVGRRGVVLGGLAAGALAGGLPLPRRARAQTGVRVGLMLPFSGTYAALGANIADALKLAVEEQGGLLGGRPVEYVELDDESDPAKAAQNASRLVVGEEVDFLVGTVHSGVQMAIVQVAREEGVMTFMPNAGIKEATGTLCAPNLFRTSFSNWQPANACARPVFEAGLKRAVVMSWDYGAGHESAEGFRDGFTALGGEIVSELFLPFPDVEFQAQLTQIASLSPDAVFVFFAGAGAVKFTADYMAAGLKDRIPLYSTFLTEGTLVAQGASAEGLLTTLHYADDLPNAKNQAFRPAFEAATGRIADVYAVQGYDTGVALAVAAAAVEGDLDDQPAMIAALEAHEFDSPRGAWRFAASHNPVQDFYLRRAEGGLNRFVSVAAEDLADPATGCEMG